MVTLDSDIGFQGKHDNEEYDFHYYRHWIKFVLPFAIMSVGYVVIFLIFTAFVQQEVEDALVRHTFLAICIFLTLLLHFNFLKEFYVRFLYVVIVTDKTVHRIRKTLFFTDDHQSIHLKSVQDVKKIKHGILPNLFNYGKITLEAQETTLALHYVPKVKRVHEKLLKLQSKVKTS